jgi:putative salt-induced outer membrane protein YdiY
LQNKTIHAVFVTCFFSFLVSADQVTLKNGDRLTGKIQKSDEASLILKTDYAGDVKIDRKMIVSIVSDDALNVALKDGAKLQGKVETVEDAVRIHPAAGAPVTAKLEAVTALRTDAEQKIWEREQERLLHPRLNDFWSGFVSLGFASASGNAQTTTINTSAAASRAAGKNKMGIYFNQVYATQSTTEPTGATASRISGGYRIDRDVSKRMFVFGATDFDYDRFLLLDLRTVFGGGLGVHVWKGSNGFLDLGGGGVFNREKFSTGRIRKSGELLITQELGYTLLNKVKLFERLQFYPNLSETGEYRLNFDTGASVPILKFLEWNFGVNNRYLSNPVAGRKTNDILLTTGLRVSFDQTRR